MEAQELMQVALRVLNAITSRRKPTYEDTAFLKQHAWPDNPEAPIDELARDIICRELKSHATYRSIGS
jgi:hypothetical protein